MEEPDFLIFASDATLAALWAGALLLLALVALLAERRRLRRQRIDAVGCMPWTAIFLTAAFAATVLLTLALKGWIAG
ncbi:hypothetical protein FHS61_002459 [Altererythrobacter atlanticus]|uniref:hypothetical protein n=1 Tax=Croceibacterium atlanticum TaxID=1267766 RepID=UPI0017905C47|nr:hypothetical protein [Croceibacterium atlanticum]MBB5733424.1 hypothetical protein [Croceibacterium atlanticum]